MSDQRWGLPESWAWSDIGTIAKIVGGGTPSSKDDDNFTNHGIPWVTPADLTGYEGVTISRGRRDLTQKGFANCGAQMLPRGAVLYSSRAPIGYCAIAANELCTNQGFKSLILSPDLSPEYVRHYLLSAKGYAESLASGTTFLELSGSRMAELAIPLAPLPEQRRIVAKVDGLTARTARARKELSRIPSLVAKYKETLLTRAFTGRLTDDWRNGQNNLPSDISRLVDGIRLERTKIRAQEGLRNSGKNRSRPVAQLELPHLPQSWAWLSFDDCSWDMTVGHVGPMKDRYVENGIPFLRSMNIRANKVDLSKVVYIDEAFHNELRKSEIRAGELLVVRTGAPGTAAVVPDELGVANCSDLVIARMVPSLNPHFAAFYMNSQFAKAAVRGMQVGVAQQHFNVGSMSEMPIPVTTVEEQAEIVRRIESAFGWLDRIAADHAAAARLLPKLDAAILTKAFRGELVPQDPNDEPASVLLERIKTQRSAPQPRQFQGRKAKASKDQTMTVKPLSVRDQLLKDSGNWPPEGLPYEEIAKRIERPYDEMRDALFELLSGEAPPLVQKFDRKREVMVLLRAAA